MRGASAEGVVVKARLSARLLSLPEPAVGDVTLFLPPPPLMLLGALFVASGDDVFLFGPSPPEETVIRDFGLGPVDAWGETTIGDGELSVTSIVRAGLLSRELVVSLGEWNKRNLG